MIWNPSEGITIAGFTLHFYSLMFVVAFSLGYFIMKKIYERENRSQDELDKLFFYTFIATLLGARLGDVFFYSWDYYQHHLKEILLPFKFEPEFEFTGFRGLASHGAAIAIILAMIVYSRIIKKPLLWILDRVVLSITIGGVFVRFGNFFNSEIYGHIVDKSFPFGIKFIREDEFWKGKNIFNITQTNDLNQAYKLIETDPRFSSVLEAIPFRHPTQLYEAFGYAILFIILFFMYWKTDARNYLGKIFGVFLVFLWTIRFIVEYVKESQGGFESSLGLLSTGQWLSIPFIIVGIYIWATAKKRLYQTA
ncbi:prolipoprotein diacylglyceryl transferase [Flavobacterium dauae]|uniref:prolipoprotein diacylglyceryl transferase n=1 Tax=Flavobacterium dauae TaxID=1563479 RepID=UPI00101B43E6|nr:prolipoprotein diacylglyceryl transferase [Flavobacterium dauae]WLD23032.1 prolipoprotein diacylglyceryl transferase [Flavobacterium dauae]